MSARAIAVMRPLPAIAAVVAVLFAYVYFASAGELEFRRGQWYDGLYASQTDGFLSGRLSMSHIPDPALLALGDPYVFDNRKDIAYIWDASLYRGRYYLYFSPLPIVLFTLPFRLVTKGYPADALTTLFFTAWAFLASVAFARRALRHLAALRAIPLTLWIVVLGAGNLIPFFLVEGRVYEIAVACGMAMTMSWAYALLRFVEAPSVRTAAFMTLFLALAIVARPNLIVLGVIAAVALLPVRRNVRVLVAAAVPLLAIGVAYGAYNYARFGSPLETGMTYQLTVTPMRDETPCSLCSRGDLSRFFNTSLQYLLLPPKFVSTFPYVALRWNDVDPRVSFPAIPEQVGGIAAITPLVMIGSALALLLLLARRVRDDVTRAAMLLFGGGWLVLLSLSTCRWLTARYSLDFYGLMLLATIVAVERGVAFLVDAGVAAKPLRIVIAAIASYSLVVGLLLGFTGRDNAFQKRNPAAFARAESFFR